MITYDLRAEIIDKQDQIIKKQAEHIETLKRIIELDEQIKLSLRNVIESYEREYGK